MLKKEMSVTKAKGIHAFPSGGISIRSLSAQYTRAPQNRVKFFLDLIKCDYGKAYTVAIRVRDINNLEI